MTVILDYSKLESIILYN